MARNNESAVMWQAEDKSVTLIDVPTSISSAQRCYHDNSGRDVLLSTEPLEEPYQTNEPKSAAARAKLVNNTVDAALHVEYAALLEAALGKTRASHVGDWCLPRPFIEPATRGNKKRKLHDETSNTESQTHPPGTLEDALPQREVPSDLSHTLLPHLSEQSITHVHGIDDTDNFESAEHDQAVLGDQMRTATDHEELSFTDPSNPAASFKFLLPPGSSFILGTCSDARTLHTSNRAQSQELEVPRTFDFVLLDPPWPNSSVKRTHKTANSTYSTSPSLYDIQQLLMGMDLDVLMADQCLVAIWITNKPAVRDLVLGEDGLFDCCGVELIEEWIWLKTTKSGDPVTPIDSVWRKPYEILLLGRKRRRYKGASDEASGDGGARKRRVLVSIPDLHSRKPCLKSLVEELVPDPNHYRALEVFARHLVAGWWSWGDECIKFNWKGYWRTGEDSNER